jgi:acetoin utilization deacetylase AcuC-like enzyme
MAQSYRKIAILDVDYHAGNGTQQIFYQNPNVLTASLHADPAFGYPYYAGQVNKLMKDLDPVSIEISLYKNDTNQNQYLDTLEQALKLIYEFDPKYLVVSAGMDIYYEEPLSCFKLSQEGIHMIGKQVARLKLPTLIVMEGGYHLPSLGDNFVAFLEPFAE